MVVRWKPSTSTITELTACASALSSRYNLHNQGQLCDLPATLPGFPPAPGRSVPGTPFPPVPGAAIPRPGYPDRPDDHPGPTAKPVPPPAEPAPVTGRTLAGTGSKLLRTGFRPTAHP